MQYSTIQYNTIRHTTLQYTALHYTTPHHTTLHYTTSLYSTSLDYSPNVSSLATKKQPPTTRRHKPPTNITYRLPYRCAIDAVSNIYYTIIFIIFRYVLSDIA